MPRRSSIRLVALTLAYAIAAQSATAQESDAAPAPGYARTLSLVAQPSVQST